VHAMNGAAASTWSARSFDAGWVGRNTLSAGLSYGGLSNSSTRAVGSRPHTTFSLGVARSHVNALHCLGLP
jgi:hypothetical protein